MTDRDYYRLIDTAVRAMIEARRVEQDIDRILTLISEVGDDVSAGGTVISFEKKFTERGSAYTYAAVKRSDDGLWSITPVKFTDPITWDDLVLHTYAAVKRSDDGIWSVTSAKFTDPITWDDLVLFMVSGVYPTTKYDIMVPYIKPETTQGDTESPTAE